MPENSLNVAQNQVALVTGGARRIGRVIVETLHQAGFRVGIHCNESVDEAEALADKLNQQRSASACVFKADFHHPFDGQLVEALLDWGGQWDLLVNNASIFVRDTAPTVDWDQLFQINVRWPYDLSQAFFRVYTGSQGGIVNLTDIHAEFPLKGYSIYCQTKAALALQTKALAKAFAPRVRVNAVAPGAVLWPEKNNAIDQMMQKKIIDQTPLHRHGDPLFVAKATLFFVENQFVTGQILAVDGGRSLHYK